MAGGLEVPEFNQYLRVGQVIELMDRFNGAEVPGFNRCVTQLLVIEARDFRH